MAHKTEREKDNLYRLIFQLDPDEKGYIVLLTFLENGAKDLMDRSKVSPDNAPEIFKLMDLDGDKMINVDDLKKMLNLFGDELPSYYVKEMLKEVDNDGDDFISYDEFLFFTTGVIN